MTDDDESGRRSRPAGAVATPPDAEAVSPTQDTVATEPASRAVVNLPPPGYRLGELIGRGGMGEVLAAADLRLGRDVALKRLRTANPGDEQLTRFLREARIQARLDHPAIVPVHELGTDPSGHPYFTMKRISGRTFAEELARGAPTQKLLRAFVDVCLAIELAHARGVVHRDLKPANIMLGDYGEVYVLDWGIARLLDEPQPAAGDERDTLEDGTQTGALLGTPGFMSPQQVSGLPATPAADVYALGAILFEVLAGEPLHPRGAGAIASTLSSPQDAPARRKPEGAVAPELDAACFDALAEDPAQRPTARVLARRVEAYLDGDRDGEARRALALDHLALAREALASDSPDARARAIRTAGRALALDPQSADAAELVTSLIVEPPAEYPPALVASLERDDRGATSQRSRIAVTSYGLLFTFWIVLPFVHVTSWTSIVLFYVITAALTAYSAHAARVGSYSIVIGGTGNLLLAVLFSRVAGPFVLTPLIVAGPLLALTANRWMRRARWRVVAYVVIAVMAPIVLEWTGVLSSTWSMKPGALTTHSEVIQMSGVLGQVMLITGTIAFTALLGMIALRIHRDAAASRRQLHVQAWQMRQLLPNDPGGWVGAAV